MSKAFQILAWSMLCLATIYPDSYNLIDTSCCKMWVNCAMTLSVLGLIYGSLSFFRALGLRIDLFPRIFVLTVFALLVYSAVLYVGGFTQKFTGGYDNSAGLALCLAMAFSLLPNARLGDKKWLIWMLGIAFVLGLLLVKSRTGVICVLFQLLLAKSGLLRRKVKWFCLLLFVLVPVLWYSKSGSSFGRLFILLIAFQMFLVHPFLGWGTGGFEAHYMDYQSEYFKNNPDSSFAILAGTTHHPLNELVAIAVDYGIFALVLIVLLLYCFLKRNVRLGNMMVVRMLSCIILFSLFSYPLRYPVTFLCLLVIALESYRNRVRGQKYSCYIKIGVIAVSLSAISLSCVQHRLYRQWSDVAVSSSDIVRKSDLRKYQLLARNEKLAGNPQFMYNYSLTLYDKGEYVLAQKEMEKCLASYSDYDLELLAGDIYCALENDSQALSHYKKAHEMCPACVMPFYSMYKMYEKRGKYPKMAAIRKSMETKRLKVRSIEVLRLLEEMKVTRDDI